MVGMPALDMRARLRKTAPPMWNTLACCVRSAPAYRDERHEDGRKWERREERGERGREKRIRGDEKIWRGERGREHRLNEGDEGKAVLLGNLHDAQ